MYRPAAGRRSPGRRPADEAGHAGPRCTAQTTATEERRQHHHDERADHLVARLQVGAVVPQDHQDQERHRADERREHARPHPPREPGSHHRAEREPESPAQRPEHRRRHHPRTGSVDVRLERRRRTSEQQTRDHRDRRSEPHGPRVLHRHRVRLLCGESGERPDQRRVWARDAQRRLHAVGPERPDRVGKLHLHPAAGGAVDGIAPIEAAQAARDRRVRSSTIR